MWIKLVFLGTSAAVPTRDRGLPCIALIRNGRIALFDVGEGAQYKMLIYGLSVLRVHAIYITHPHGDHVFGLPGLIHTMNMYGATHKLKIYAPKPVIKFLEETFEMSGHKPLFDVELYELSPGLTSKFQDLTIKAFTVDHIDNSYGFTIQQPMIPGKFNPEAALKLGVPKGPLWKRLQMGEDVTLPDGRIVRSKDVVGEPRPGVKIVYTGDTRPIDVVVKESRDADVLIHDSTFDSSLKELAYKQGHSTAYDAAVIAKDANVMLLILTHISARYKDCKILEDEARKVFSRSLVAEDGLTVYLR